MRHTSHWERTKYLYTCVHDLATCVVLYMCGRLHVFWLYDCLASCVVATCVVGYMWLATCMVGYMYGRLHVCWLHEWLRSPPHLTCMDERFVMRWN